MTQPETDYVSNVGIAVEAFCIPATTQAFTTSFGVDIDRKESLLILHGTIVARMMRFSSKVLIGSMMARAIAEALRSVRMPY